MIKFVHEQAGVISADRCWCAFDSKGYLYTHDTFLGLVFLIIKEWRHDRHMVG